MVVDRLSKKLTLSLLSPRIKQSILPKLQGMPKKIIYYWDAKLHGMPKKMIYDWDAKFTSKFWKYVFAYLGT